MQVILIEAVDKLGKIGDVVNVADGYGRNYLIPRKKAIRATKSNIVYFEQQKAAIEAENQHKKQVAEELASKLKGLSITIVRQASDDGRLFGSVSARDIADAIESTSGNKVPYDTIILDSKYKSVGIYDVFINLHAEVKAKVTLSIARSVEEAKSNLEEALTQPKEEVA